MTPEAIDAALNYISVSMYYYKLPEVFQEKFKELIDAKLITAIALSDILIGMKYLDINANINKGYEAKYFGRIISVNCYELLNNNSKYVMSNAVVKYRNIPEIKQHIKEFDTHKKTSDLFFNKHKNKLYEIRNSSLCHRDNSNGIEQIKYIDSMSLDYIASVADEVIELNINLMDSYAKLMDLLLKQSY